MNTITYMTRHKSYEDILEHLSERHKNILEVLGDKEMTTREIAEALYKQEYADTPDVNNSRPRITELEKLGLVVAEKTKQCSTTKKTVAVYRKASQIEQMQVANMQHIPQL